MSWWSFIPYLASRESEELKKSGASTTDYLGYRFLGKDTNKSWGKYIKDFTNPLKVETQWESFKNLLDPFGDFGLGGTKKKKKKSSPKIAGKTQEQWVTELGMSEEEYQSHLSELMRTISTSAAESRNRSSEIAAYGDLPEASRLAAERGINIRQNQAVGEGAVRLQQIQEQMDREAQRTVMQMFAAKESSDENYARMLEQQSTQSMGNLLNLLGSYLIESYLSNKNTSQNPNQGSNAGSQNPTYYPSYGTGPI